MSEILGNLTALVTAVGLLIVAVGTSAAKIASCLSDLRRQTARVQSTANKTDRKVEDQTHAIRDELGKLHEAVDNLSHMFMQRAAITDAKFERVHSEIERSDHERAKQDR